MFHPVFDEWLHYRDRGIVELTFRYYLRFEKSTSHAHARVIVRPAQCGESPVRAYV